MTSDGFADFLARIARTPLLEPADEVRLARRIQRGDPAAGPKYVMLAVGCSDGGVCPRYQSHCSASRRHCRLLRLALLRIRRLDCRRRHLFRILVPSRA